AQESAISVSMSGDLYAVEDGFITYTITVTNNSTDTPSPVTLTDYLSGFTTLVSWIPQDPGWSVDTSVPFRVHAWTDSLAPGASATFELIARVFSETAFGTLIDNSASVGPVTGNIDFTDASFETTVVTAKIVGDVLLVEGAANTVLTVDTTDRSNAQVT